MPRDGDGDGSRVGGEAEVEGRPSWCDTERQMGLCHAVPRRAAPCRAVPCCAVPPCAVPCHAMLCYPQPQPGSALSPRSPYPWHR